ncbi:MAG: hypothetical protein H6658_10665 [Ardenticatenaceae bacterium]|nr:hypothetical protein [Ardenticatenaceae bacterium]
MKKSISVGLLLTLLLALTVGILQAQEEHGFIQGRIYKDVNGDGKCVGTGLAGEVPLPNVNVQFTNSAGDVVITHYSGPEGIFGLVRAGFSWWEVTVLPPTGWVVTSEPTIFVPVFADSLSHDDVNFCLSEGAPARVVALLPESGAAGNVGLMITAVSGLVLLVAGVGLEIRRRLA